MIDPNIKFNPEFGTDEEIIKLINSFKEDIQTHIDRVKKLMSDPKKYHFEKLQHLSEKAFYGFKKFSEGEVHSYKRMLVMLDKIQKMIEGE